MRKWVPGVLVTAGITAGAMLSGQPSWADEHEREHEHWHGHIERFHEHDWDLWRGGAWHHDFHDGRWGWWWVAGGAWYFYPQPVYPYPDPYEPPVAVVVQPAPPAAAPPPPPPTPQNWYYCEGARGYYPYVPACPGGWRVVPATPGTPPAMPGGPPGAPR